jgi:hypothetical protein
LKEEQMANEQELTKVEAMPMAPEIPEREKLAQAIATEKKARAQRVMATIEQICKDNNCKFIATPTLVEQPTGGFIISANPGIMPL